VTREAALTQILNANFGSYRRLAHFLPKNEKAVMKWASKFRAILPQAIHPLYGKNSRLAALEEIPVVEISQQSPQVTGCKGLISGNRNVEYIEERILGTPDNSMH